MATFTFFNHTSQIIGDGGTDMDADVFDIYLSNETPLAADTIPANVAAITEQNGYTETALTTDWTLVTATTTLGNNADVEWTASGGSFGPFQYVVIYDETRAAAPVDALFGYWDVGAATTITTGNKFIVDLNAGFDIFSLG